MSDLFRLEAESQTQVLTASLLALEREPTAADQLEACMRAAHSLKGAARIVGLSAGVDVAHVMEDCFVAAQQGGVVLRQRHIDVLLSGVDLLTRIAGTPEAEAARWMNDRRPEVEYFLSTLAAMLAEREAPPQPAPASHELPLEDGAPAPELREAIAAAAMAEQQPVGAADPRDGGERVLRVTAENLNRLLGLAGESLVESRWLKRFAESLLRLKRLQDHAGKTLDVLRETLSDQLGNSEVEIALLDLQRETAAHRQFLAERLVELELFGGRSTALSQRLYDEALASRMRPFTDGVRGFPRMVRNLSRSLGKQIRLELIGETTQVDRDILEKLDAPLGHLLRNAIDHGIESPDIRAAAGKAAEGVIRLEARHNAGMLQIIVSDDGAGVDLDRLRRTIVERKLTNVETAEKLTEGELLEFLFLPGFTMKETVTEISGRGVGLDVVQNMLKQVRGSVRVSFQPGKGTRFQLQLPLTLSVVRTLLANVGGEPYAFPLAYIARTMKVPRRKIELIEGRQHVDFDGALVGLVNAQQVLGGDEAQPPDDDIPVIIVGEPGHAYGLVADRFLGERELVVQPLDRRLGKIKDIAAGALMEDGSPVLIVDVEDLIRSVDKLVSAGELSKVRRGAEANDGTKRKRVLVVDDSLTVRELERKLLDHYGFEVEAAVDGMDGWNAVRTGRFDLIVTDVDMPRMDGIELVTLIKKDPNLRSLPVMIVSYKDREEDRQRGLDAGADYYLTKGSFHDETLLQAVIDLIGEADGAAGSVSA